MSETSASSEPYALVVDDDGLIRMDAAAILEDAGFRTFEACNGDEAVALLAEHHAVITVLFTDVHMPGARDGFAVARETANLWPHIAIVVASGEARPGPGDLPEQACFIAKPFSAELVHNHLQEMLPDGQKPEPLRQSAARRGADARS